MGSVVATWLVHSTLDQAVQVWVLAEDSVLCSWVLDTLLLITVPLSTQVYKWVPVKLQMSVFNISEV